VTLLRQESIHPSYQTEKKQVRKPSTEDKATGELHEAKGTIKEKVGKYQRPGRKPTAKRKKDAGKAQNRNGKVENLVRK
jgi:uncharacterized protein YjbJ (UPF0337 family)